MESKAAFIVLLLCFSTVAVSATLSQEDYVCVYTVFVRTSKTFRAGTDSKISLALYDDTGAGVLIRDLEAWGGAMEKGHDYFERGNLDIFTGKVPCLSRPVCAMELTSDGTGSHPSWYCNYVEVTTTGPQTQCAQINFTVEQWLSPDKSPYQLSVTRDSCSNAPLNRLPKKLLPVETLSNVAVS
uniref:Catalase n=1 Tax=Opuntia streptacantha TaxID=393608 RepID=A0A7C8YMX3_OPUST